MRVNCLGTGRSPVVGVEPAGHHSRERRANGGAEGVRTPDLFHAMEARSQLRHSPTLYRIPLILARVPARLRRATRLCGRPAGEARAACSRRFGGPWPHTGAAQISWRGSPLGYAERPAYAAAPLEKRGRPARAGLGAPGPIPALRKFWGGAGRGDSGRLEVVSKSRRQALRSCAVGLFLVSMPHESQSGMAGTPFLRPLLALSSVGRESSSVLRTGIQPRCGSRPPCVLANHPVSPLPESRSPTCG